MGLIFSGCGLAWSACCALGSAVCCACNFVKCCCTGGMGSKGVPKWMAKLLYVTFLGIATLVAYLIGRFGENELVDENAEVAGFEIFSVNVQCEDVTGGRVCSGDSAIYRASFACVLFFSLMLIGTIPRPTFSGDDNWTPLFGEGFHRGWWGIKTVLFFGGLIGCFFIPSSAFDETIYENFARAISTIFLAVQVLVLIDFAYSWNDTWVSRAFDGDEESKGWVYALLFFAVVLYGIALAGMISLFIIYEGCELITIFCSITAIAVVLFVGLGVGSVYVVNAFRFIACQELLDPEDDAEEASVAPASVVACYIVYLLWSSSRSNPDISPECNPFDEILGRNGAEIAVGIGFAVLSLTWTAWAASGGGDALLNGAKDDGAYQIGENEDGTAKYAKDDGGDDDEDDEPEARLWLFHFLMLSASFYMAMVLTNWGVSELDISLATNETGVNATASAGDVGLISMWVKIAAQWTAILLFVWSMVAPYILDREFS